MKNNISKSNSISGLSTYDTGESIVNINGNKYYYLDDELHRENGPAIEYANGTKLWYIDGKPHRKDGPAIEYANGNKCWYLNGKHINVNSQEEFERYIKIMVFI